MTWRETKIGSSYREPTVSAMLSHLFIAQVGSDTLENWSAGTALQCMDERECIQLFRNNIYAVKAFFKKIKL